MKLKNDSASRAGRLVLTGMLALAWCGRPHIARAAGDADAEQVRKLADSIDATAKLYAALDRDLPRDRFDPAAIVGAVGKDPVKLFGWVHDQTRYVPYRGALRGAVGVLMDRCGNSLDRALLLAALLQRAGYQARLAHGQLSAEQADKILNAVWDHPASAQPAEAPAANPDDQIATVATRYQIDPQQLRTDMQRQELASEKAAEDLVAAVTDQTDRLSRLLKAPDGAGDKTRQIAVQDIADHWWCQCRQQDQWIDYDVLRPDAKPGDHLVDVTETIDLKPDQPALPLPASLMNEIEVRVAIEQWRDGKTEVRIPFRYALRPAELGGGPVTLVIAPLDWPQDIDPGKGDPAAAYRAALLKQTRWVAALAVPQDQIVQKGFDENGELIDKPIEDAMAKLGKTIGGAASKLKDIFDTTAAPASQPVTGKLTAAWIEFEVRAPGRERRVIRRDVFDLFGHARRSAGRLDEPMIDDAARLARSAALTRQADLLAVGCLLPPRLVAHVRLQQVATAGPPMAAVLREAPKVPLKQSFDKISQVHPPPMALLELAAAREGPVPDSRAVVDQPNLFALHRTVSFTGEGKLVSREIIDIIANELQMRPGGEDGAFAERLRQGVLETNLESIALAPRRRGANTAALFAASQVQGVRWVSLQKPEDASFADVKLDEDTRMRIADDLRAGYAVVAPVTPIRSGGVARAGWWRVDPRTGNCVGYVAGGTGSEFAEEAIHYFYILVAVVDAGHAIHSCYSGASGMQALGCSVCACVAIAVLEFASYGGLHGAGAFDSLTLGGVGAGGAAALSHACVAVLGGGE